MMLRRTDPADIKAARLLALALMKLGHWQQAEIILSEIHQFCETEENSQSAILNFYRSITAFKQKKLSDARNWLSRFRSIIAGARS